MLDKILGELLRKGERKQEARFQTNARALNGYLTVLITASDALSALRKRSRAHKRSPRSTLVSVALVPRGGCA